MPESNGAELVDGQIVEVCMSGLSNWVGGKLLTRINNYLDDSAIGFAFPEGAGYAIWPSRPGHVRKPDVSFVEGRKLPDGPPDGGWLYVVPDLAVEVVSPNDEAEELEQKLRDYRDAGIPLIWVIFPVARTALVIRHDRMRTELTDSDILQGEDVLPGFQVPISSLLKPPAR
jgi:Uma2 family endonuclease